MTSLSNLRDLYAPTSCICTVAATVATVAVFPTETLHLNSPCYTNEQNTFTSKLNDYVMSTRLLNEGARSDDQPEEEHPGPLDGLHRRQQQQQHPQAQVSGGRCFINRVLFAFKLSVISINLARLHVNYIRPAIIKRCTVSI